MNPENPRKFETDSDPQTQETPRHRHSRHPRRGRRGFFGLAALVGIGAFVAVTFYTPAAAAFGRSGGWGHHGPRGELTEAKALEHARKGADRLIGRVDGTDAQRAALDPIIERAVPEMLALRADGKALKAEFHAAVTGGELDREELEALRVKGLALADTATSRMLDALVEVSNVLTPEQRAEVSEDLARMEKWHR